jgi:hypothetical protein
LQSSNQKGCRGKFLSDLKERNSAKMPSHSCGLLIGSHGPPGDDGNNNFELHTSELSNEPVFNYLLAISIAHIT